MAAYRRVYDSRDLQVECQELNNIWLTESGRNLVYVVVNLSTTPDNVTKLPCEMLISYKLVYMSV